MTATEATSPAPPSDHVRALVGRGTLYSLATAMQLLVAIIALPIVTRLLPIAAYGEIAVAIVVQLVLALVASVGLPEVLTRTFFKTADGSRRAAALVALVVATSTAVAGLADLTGSRWSTSLLGLAYTAPLRLAVWSSVPLAVLLTAQALLRARDRAAAFVLSAALATAGTQAAGVIAIVTSERTSAAYMAGFLAGTILAATVTVAASGIALRPLRDVRFVRSTLRISLPVVAHSVSLYVIWAGNRAVLTRLEGRAAAATFQVAYLVGGLTVLFVSAVYGAWSPIVLGADERRWITLAETSRVVYRFVAAATSAVALAAPVALLVLAPSTYDPRALASTSSIVSLSAIPFAVYTASVLVVIWYGRTVALAVATSVAACANVAINLILIPHFGLNGAAAASVISYTLQALLVGGIAQRLAAVPSTGAVLFRVTAGTCAAVAAAEAMPTSLPWLVVRVGAALILLGWLVRAALRIRSSGATGALK
ncbi:MAG: polysaccharide biosynthesis C-terminal domain-containing protein [Gaiellaceae bacterium]